MIDQTWYYMDSAEAQQGPITIPQLQSLVASGAITTETQVWTEALGEQWIPAANVEGLFTAAPVAPATTAAPTLRAPTLATTTPNAADYQQPSPAATTPMIPSTPTTQAVTGVPVPSSLAAQQQAANPYQSPVADPQQLGEGLYPATIKKGGSMGLWCMLLFGGILCIALGMMVSGVFSQDLGASTDKTQAMIGLGLVLLGYGCMAFSGILTYIYLYRAWKCLQPGGATVSPGAAIGFLFIPLFNIYWIFKAIGGLPRQWNQITSAYPNTKNAPKLSIGAFVCMLLIPIIGQMIWLSQITKGLNFMAGLHFQQSRPAGSALSGLGSSANFQ
jgi:hypothetical protein